MLQEAEIKQRFERVCDAIGEASSAIGDGQSSPELKQCIDKLDEQSESARAVMQSHDYQEICDCVDSLEMLGDEAKRTCMRDGQSQPQLASAITHMHDELSDFKHKLH